MDINTVFSEIDRLKNKYISFLTDICNIESPTDYKEGVDRVGYFVKEFSEKLGFKTEVFPQKVSGDIITITMNPDSCEAPLTLCSHTDTVYPLGLFKEPKVKTDDEKIYGPGVADCKGGIAISLLAMEALSLSGYTKRPIQLILQSDEEKNSCPSNKETINYICEKAKSSVAFLNGEPSVKDTASLARKGIARYSFNIKGKAAHSSLCYKGANAIAEAAYKITELEKFKDPDGITCNCGLISGGSAANTVAETCSFVADIRFSTTKELDFIRETIKNITEKSFLEGCVTLSEEISLRPAMEESPLNYDLLDKINCIFKENGFSEFTPRKANGGSDAAYITRCNIPCIDSVGLTGSSIHSINEYAELSSLTDYAKRYCLIAEYL